MTEWKVEFHDRFKSEITDLPADVRIELLAHLVLLREKGFRLGRPEVDTLEGSRHANMKELRVRGSVGISAILPAKRFLV